MWSTGDVTPVSLPALEYICLNMREVDRAEVFGMRGHDDPLLLAREVLITATHGKSAIACHAGLPAAVIGVTPSWPGVWVAWAFGTDDWSRCALDLTRYALRVLKPHILACGAHRMQCQSRFDHAEAHRWLELLGAKAESTLSGYGRDGSDYVMFAWTRTED